MILHAVSTPLIEVAEDLKTAKGMFYSPGYVTTIEANGTPYARWVMQRYAVDFIYEDSWKIWHLFVGTDMQCRAGQPYEDLPVDLDPKDDPVAVEFGTPTLPMDAYNTRYNYYPYPIIPEPYATFSETVSCGPEGIPKNKG